MKPSIIFLLTIAILLAAGNLKAQEASVLTLVTGRMQLSAQMENVREQRVTALFAEHRFAEAENLIREIGQDSSAFGRAVYDALMWVVNHSGELKGNAPLFAHFNEAYGQHCRERKDTLHSFRADLAAVASLAHLSQDKCPWFYEMLGDLLLVSGEEGSLYLAGAAYRAAEHTAQNEWEKLAWERKAIFAMEPLVAPGGFYDKVRHFKFREALDQEATGGKKAFPWPAFRNEVSLWPAEKSAFYEFVAGQMELDANQDRKLVPSQDITLPGVDPKEVKSNLKYNAYALFLFFVLFVSVYTIIRKYRKAESEQRRQDSGGK